jgi:hypothetical protein
MRRRGGVRMLGRWWRGRSRADVFQRMYTSKSDLRWRWDGYELDRFTDVKYNDCNTIYT